MVQVHGGVQPSAGGNYRCLFILTCLRLVGAGVNALASASTCEGICSRLIVHACCAWMLDGLFPF